MEKMACYLFEARNEILVKGYIFLLFAKNVS